MSDRTTLLFALPGFRVLDVSLDADGARRVLVDPGSAVDGHMRPSTTVFVQVRALSGLCKRGNMWAHDLPCHC